MSDVRLFREYEIRSFVRRVRAALACGPCGFMEIVARTHLDCDMIRLALGTMGFTVETGRVYDLDDLDPQCDICGSFEDV